MVDRWGEPSPARVAGGLDSPAAHDRAALATVLERLRAGLHRRLDRLEELAGERPASSGTADESTARRLRELEQERAAWRAETERREREWEDRLEALEHDRKLLAEAWERLEQEQVAVLTAVRAGGTTSPSKQPTATVQANGTTRVGDEAIDRAILRQFESLRQDVRRKAEAKQSR